MYHINSKVDKPDINYMVKKTLELMKLGIRLGEVDAMHARFLSMQQELGAEIQKSCGINNANSPAQICRYMESLGNMEVYEVCCIEKKWTSNGDALKILASMGYDFAKDILLYRKAKNHAESVNSMLKARSAFDGRVHPNVSLGKTNRINYTDPALMNVPKRLLWHIVAPREDGNVLFSADIKNQEPSILINLLNIEELKDALMDERGLYETLFTKPFQQKTKLNVFVTVNETCRIVSSKEMAESSLPPVYYTPLKPSVRSVYCKGEQVKLMEICNTVTTIGVKPLLPETVSIETTSGNVYQVPVVWDEIKDKQIKTSGIIEVTGIVQGLDIRCAGIARDEFKQSWNAMTYGASIFGIKKMCKTINGDEVYRYFSKIPAFKNYKSQCVKMAERGIQRINTLFGTELIANEYDPGKLQRVLMDLPIQGTGSDILSMLIKHFDTEITLRGLVGKLEIYYTRHDELIIEGNGAWVSEVGVEHVKSIIGDILEHQIDDWIPFKVKIKEIKVEPLNLLDDSMDDMFE